MNLDVYKDEYRDFRFVRWLTETQVCESKLCLLFKILFGYIITLGGIKVYVSGYFGYIGVIRVKY